jgi:hypothetical protein
LHKLFVFHSLASRSKGDRRKADGDYQGLSFSLAEELFEYKFNCQTITPYFSLILVFYP